MLLWSYGHLWFDFQPCGYILIWPTPHIKKTNLLKTCKHSFSPDTGACGLLVPLHKETAPGKSSSSLNLMDCEGKVNDLALNKTGHVHNSLTIHPQHEGKKHSIYQRKRHRKKQREQHQRERERFKWICLRDARKEKTKGLSHGQWRKGWVSEEFRQRWSQ